MSKFIKPTKYNNETKNQMWMSMIADSHDIWCDCTSPFGHLLDSIFPEGHRDRDKTIKHIIDRDIKECRSGGAEEEGGGGVEAAATENPEEKDIKREDPFTDANVEELLAAAQDAEAR